MTFALGPRSVDGGWRGGGSVSGGGCVRAHTRLRWTGRLPTSSVQHMVRNTVRVSQSGSHSFVSHRETR